VIGVLNSTDIAQLLPLGDRILVEVRDFLLAMHVSSLIFVHCPTNLHPFLTVMSCESQIADVEDTTEGGLLMAGSSKEKPTLGTVCTLHSAAQKLVHSTCSSLTAQPCLYSPLGMLEAKWHWPLAMVLMQCVRLHFLQVVAVGSGKANEKGDVVKPTLNKGDTVLYQKYSGVDFEGENERQYVVLKENDILAALA